MINCAAPRGGTEIPMSLFTCSVCPGVGLSVLESDRHKQNTLSVSFRLGIRPGEAAMISLLPYVLRCGTEHYPDMASLSRQYDLLYAARIEPTRTRRGDVEYFGFTCSMLRQDYVPDGTDILSGVISLLHELLFCPRTENGAFVSAFVENEKAMLTDAIRSRINNKMAYAVNRCAEEMCRDELYGLPETGSEEEVRAVTPQTLYDFYRTVWERAQIRIFFSGECDRDALISEMRTLFLPISHPDIPCPQTRVIRRASGDVRTVTERQPVNQSKLALGFRTGQILADEDYLAFSLFRCLYSSSPTSKLFMNVREKLSLCYYCFAVPEAQKGLMVVTAGIQRENAERTKEEILRQWKEVCRGEFTDGELEGARRALINAYRELTDNPSGLESWYTARAMAGITRSPEDEIAMVAALTRDDVVASANKLTPDTFYLMEGTAEHGGEEEPDHAD